MPELIRTARLTGLAYLGLAVTGALGFLIVRPRLFADGDPAATLANLITNEQLARAGVAFELGIVLTQAVTAVLFYRLFRAVDAFAAGTIAAFGLVNAVVVMASAAMLATAISIAVDPVGDAAAGVQTLYLISGNLWGAGNLFFGLWLVPMGSCVLKSRWMPRPLGWILMAGGAGYVLSAFVAALAPGAAALTGILVIPATIGEFWMIAYLVARGVNRRTAAAPYSPQVPAAA